MKLCVYTIVATILFLPPVLVVHAQTPCGEIITPAGFYDEFSEEERTTILDCTNPFSRTTTLSNLLINSNPVSDNGSYQTGPLGLVEYGFTGENYFNNTNFASYYRHDGSNFIQVNTSFNQPTESEVRAEMNKFFQNNSIQANRYTEMYFAPDTYPYFFNGSPFDPIYDPIEGKYIYEVFEEAKAFVEENVVTERKPLLPGTYTVVVIEGGGPILNQRENLLLKFLGYLTPKVHAETIVRTVTFTLALPATGASSVLFLPGIQASRLYQYDSLFTSERVWEPGQNSDVRKLAMNENGETLNDIRTEDIIDEKLGLKSGGNIYKDFISFMNDLAEDKIIKSWVPFAYDWRFDVFDIVENGTLYKNGQVKNPVDEVITLAEDSLSGKVTIVAHSNGGLLAKAIMIELEKRGQSSLIDNVIFIGTPQLGTPKAIATVLHGYDQKVLRGLVIDDNVARQVINNMPGAYALLPSEKYLESSVKPIVFFKEGTVTGPLKVQYGTAIDSLTEYANFLNGTDGRVNDYESISSPYVTNPLLLSNALESHKNKLDNWQAPETTKVYKIVGVGLPTVSALEYREVKEFQNCNPNNLGQIQCAPPNLLLRPFAQFTQYGDETVTSLASEGNAEETYYFDFESFRSGTLGINRQDHASFTELNQVQSLVKGFLTNTLEMPEYTTRTKPALNKVYEVTAVDSPVRMIKVDKDNNRTGVVIEGGNEVILEEIPGSTYTEFAGTKYIITPKDIQSTTTLVGEDYGGYTLTLATINATDEQVVTSQIVNATTTPTMVATFTSKNGTSSTIVTDYDGNGSIDSEMTLNGALVTKSEVSFTLVRQEITKLNLPKLRQVPLLLLLDTAQTLSKSTRNKTLSIKLAQESLRALISLIKQYEKNRWITTADSQKIQTMVHQLSVTIK